MVEEIVIFVPYRHNENNDVLKRFIAGGPVASKE